VQESLTPATFKSKKISKKMKKTYFAPELEVFEVNMKAAVLMESGGGIKDNGEVNTGDNDSHSDNPNEDYGW